MAAQKLHQILEYQILKERHISFTSMKKRRRKYKNVEKMSNISELEKIFLLTMVQNAKCYRITRQENPEFLGEFNGGAKTTSNSGVISFEYREI